jgi:amidase
LLKDYYCYTDGDPYYEGSKFLQELRWRSDGESYLAQKLRTAGFIFLGKTNLPEFASGPVTEPLALAPLVIRGTPAARPADPAGVRRLRSRLAVAVAHASDGTGSSVARPGVADWLD